MITLDLREAIQLQSLYGPSTGAYKLVADLGQARDSVLQFLTAPMPREEPTVTTTDLYLELRERGAHWDLYRCESVAFTPLTADLREAGRSVLAFLCAPLPLYSLELCRSQYPGSPRVIEEWQEALTQREIDEIAERAPLLNGFFYRKARVAEGSR